MTNNQDLLCKMSHKQINFASRDYLRNSHRFPIKLCYKNRFNIASLDKSLVQIFYRDITNIHILENKFLILSVCYNGK